MSDSDIHYRNPYTPYGVRLANVAGSSGFLCHECGYYAGTMDWNFPGVSGPFWRLYYNSEPGNWVNVNGQKWPLRPDRVILMPPDLKFDCCGPTRVHHFWLHFNFTESTTFDDSAPISISCDTLLQPLLTQLARDLQNPKAPAMDQILHECSALLHLCVSKFPSTSRRSFPRAIEEILSFIQQSYRSNLPNTLLARKAGRSVEGFVRWFRSHTGTTPADYVSKTRLDHAARFLAFSDQSIEEIAEECGFPNRHYFTRLFSRRYDRGPASFRAAHRQLYGTEESYRRNAPSKPPSTVMT